MAPPATMRYRHPIEDPNHPLNRRPAWTDDPNHPINANWMVGRSVNLPLAHWMPPSPSSFPPPPPPMQHNQPLEYPLPTMTVANLSRGESQYRMTGPQTTRGP